jgi:hypothetical protein
LGTGVTLRDYVRLITDTGGAMKEPAVLRMTSPALGLLERVGLDSAGWLEAMRRPGQMQGTALGLALARSGEALRRGVKRIHDRMRGLLRAAQAVVPSTAGVVPNPGGC